MNKKIDLKKLVSPNFLQEVDQLDLHKYHFQTLVRNESINYLCLNKRLTWMAVGHEYIEPELLDWIDTIPKGESLYDIGASNGIFSFYASAKGLSVTAFEPDASNFFLLSYNNFINNNKLKSFFNVALSNENKISVVNSPKYEIGGHLKFIDSDKDVNGVKFLSEYSQSVLQFTLDNFIQTYKLDYPKFLKVDVDGSEINALIGADLCLKKTNSIFIECHEDQFYRVNTIISKRHKFRLKLKKQVQNYAELFNCIYTKN